MWAVEAVGLEKDYRRPFGKASRALAGVTLSIPRGSIFGLLGLNGAGKTTFIKTLLAVVRPSRGSVRVLGGSPELPEVRAKIGYLPERSYYPPTATALTHLRSIARLKGLAPSPGELERLLERVGLVVNSAKVASYSKGMTQRLGLAAALLGRPELLLLDEPTDGIDPLGRLEVRRILVEERARGATVVLNSHLVAETERIADRVAILSGGRVLREGSLHELVRPTSSWRVRFAGAADSQALAELGFTPLSGGAYSLPAPDPEALNRTLEQARARGAWLIELTAEGHGLEEELVRLLGPGEPS